VKHRASIKFWKYYAELPESVKCLAKENYRILKHNLGHTSLHFKKVGRFWSVRVGIHYRAIAIEDGEDIVWFWIGHHSEYDRLINSR
jgi:hypothetical protein